MVCGRQKIFAGRKSLSLSDNHPKTETGTWTRCCSISLVKSVSQDVGRHFDTLSVGCNVLIAGKDKARLRQSLQPDYATARNLVHHVNGKKQPDTIHRPKTILFSLRPAHLLPLPLLLGRGLAASSQPACDWPSGTWTPSGGDAVNNQGTGVLLPIVQRLVVQSGWLVLSHLDLVRPECYWIISVRK